MKSKLQELIIFEMANNHQGDVKHGMRIIDEMSKISRRYKIKGAVKLQYRNLDSFIHRDFVDRKDVKHIPRFLETRLSWEDFHSLVMATKENGMMSVVTPFDEHSVEKALDHGVDILKIASCSCMDWPLLNVVAKSNKPVICSTGGCAIQDIDKIVSFFEHRGVSDLALLHCIGIYPTKDKDQQLHFMKRMMLRYPDQIIGYSGHENPSNLGVARAAVAIGAKILERHVGVPNEKINLNAYSMNPGECNAWVEEIVRTRELCKMPNGEKHVSEDELSSLNSLSRGVYSKADIKKGDKISSDKVFFAMPCQKDQTPTKEYLEIMKASKDYVAGEPIMESREYNPYQRVRSVVHEAKGLLREARISIGQEYEVELSHHYGMDSFRRFGATIVNFFNREYCKKLIVLLQGQKHPSHAHSKKEETFQVLYGVMELVLDGEKENMYPGDVQLIRRGQYHSFSTKTGCVFEEISTTYYKGDSIYEDKKIQQLDPIGRKTVIESW
ncbi:N-acetylneuraminate synthase family protein [Desulfococcaceae bacterium HSG7]|nr:N-acetylneuraminate synthase family protein [Desulfococcaceae bacterium HSG7]